MTTFNPKPSLKYVYGAIPVIGIIFLIFLGGEIESDRLQYLIFPFLLYSAFFFVYPYFLWRNQRTVIITDSYCEVHQKHKTETFNIENLSRVDFTNNVGTGRGGYYDQVTLRHFGQNKIIIRSYDIENFKLFRLKINLLFPDHVEIRDSFEGIIQRRKINR